jgi:hypothetical protein
MYQYLYWYSVAIPYGTTTIYREYNIKAFKITPFVRIGANKSLNFDIGPELNFSDGAKLGLLLSGNYYISINDRISIPVKIRADIIKIVTVIAPISLSTGISINF